MAALVALAQRFEFNFEVRIIDPPRKSSAFIDLEISCECRRASLAGLYRLLVRRRRSVSWMLLKVEHTASKTHQPMPGS